MQNHDYTHLVPTPSCSEDVTPTAEACDWLTSQGISDDGTQEYQEARAVAEVDAVTLNSIRNLGVDATHCRTLNYWVGGFNSEKDLVACLTTAFQEGFFVRFAGRSPGLPGLSAHLERRGSQLQSELTPRTTRLHALAKSHRGTYLGWEVVVEPKDIRRGLPSSYYKYPLRVGTAFGGSEKYFELASSEHKC